MQTQAVEGNFSKRILLTYETHFTRDSIFNIHDFHHWAANNSRNSPILSPISFQRERLGRSCDNWSVSNAFSSYLTRIQDISGGWSGCVVGGRVFRYPPNNRGINMTGHLHIIELTRVSC